MSPSEVCEGDGDINACVSLVNTQLGSPVELTLSIVDITTSGEGL